MKLLKKLGLTVLLASSLQSFAQKKEYPLDYGYPTPVGIEQYVYDFGDSITPWFNRTMDVHSYELDIFPEIIEGDNPPYPNFIKAGEYSYTWRSASIDYRKQFQAYSYQDVRITLGIAPSYLQQISVLGAMYHEKGHHYQHYISDSLKQVKEHSPYYFNPYDYSKKNIDSLEKDIIEEGICKYVEFKTGELIISKRKRFPYYRPKKEKDFLDSTKFHRLKYEFGFTFLKDFLDSTGFKKGVDLLLSNDPPSIEEYLNPPLYFNRIQKRNNLDALKEED